MFFLELFPMKFSDQTRLLSNMSLDLQDMADDEMFLVSLGAESGLVKLTMMADDDNVKPELPPFLLLLYVPIILLASIGPLLVNE